eukprot:2795804-Rhodomonas_salina.2
MSCFGSADISGGGADACPRILTLTRVGGWAEREAHEQPPQQGSLVSQPPSLTPVPPTPHSQKTRIRHGRSF